MWAGAGPWQVTGHVTPAVTGKGRNDNPALVTDEWGTLVGGEEEFQMSLSVGDSDSGDAWLWTHRIFGIRRGGLV